ncbi:MAG: hypothetical protein C4289_02095 [Chloroflexota bacterium]
MSDDAERGILFRGDFTPQERAILAAQFGHCRLVLVARSVIDSRVILVQWLAASGSTGRRAIPVTPGTLAALGRRHFYVLDARVNPPALVHVATSDELHRAYPGHFPGVQLAPSPLEPLYRLWDRLLRPGPAHLLVVTFLWLLAVAIYMGWVTPRC